MKTQSARIREFLIEQGRPCTVVEIAEGLGKPQDLRTYQNVHRMWRDGMLRREGVIRKYRFEVARLPIVRERMPDDEAKRRRCDGERKRRYRLLGPAARTRAQYVQECAARRQARLQSEQAEKDARKAAREQERAQREAARSKPIKPKKVAKPTRQKPTVSPRHLEPVIQQKPAQVESVSEWMARTGKQPERIPAGVVSQPLRHIGEAA